MESHRLAIASRRMPSAGQPLGGGDLLLVVLLSVLWKREDVSRQA